ncbi:MAG: heavy metal transporter [Bifidobacterium breve]|nr:heavy metal transporter [Bifidobacterium breve]
MHDMPHWHRFRNNLRLIDSGAGVGGSGDPATGDPADPGEDIDWKAKFEEQRAKDNSKAAEELQQFKDSQLSEAEKDAKRIKELEAANAAYEAERQQNEWRAQVSKETGVPASLLHGDTLEAMTANAKAIDQYAHPKPKGMPHQGKTPDGKAAGADERAWADDLFSNL